MDLITALSCFSALTSFTQMFLIGCSLISGKSCEACTELSHFDAQSVALPESQQNAKLPLLLQQVNAQHDRLSRYLPVEIISRIFSLYPEISGYTAAVCAPKPQGAIASPFRITSVCKRWREIGFSTPSIWVSLLIRYNSRERKQPCLDGIELLPLWLARCGTQRLKISIQIGRPFAHFELQNEINTMFKLVRSCASRWMTLNLTMPGDLFETFFQDHPLEALHLIHLELHQLDTYHRPQPRAIINAPFLDTIAISNMNMSGSQLDYSRITCVSIVRITGDELLLLLRCAVRLERATLLDLTFDINSIPFVPHVHKSLTHLKLRLKDNQRRPTLLEPHSLDSFSLPCLQQLSISFAHAQSDLDEKLLAFLCRSKCFLVRLELTDLNAWALPHAKFMQIIEVVPSLTYLRLSSTVYCPISSFSQHIFFRLRGLGTETGLPFLPDLENLVLEEFYSPNIFFYLSDIFAPSTRCLQTIRLKLIMVATESSIVIPHIVLSQLQLRQNMGNNQTVQLTITGRHELDADAREVDLVEESWKFYRAQAQHTHS